MSTNVSTEKGTKRARASSKTAKMTIAVAALMVALLAMVAFGQTSGQGATAQESDGQAAVASSTQADDATGSQSAESADDDLAAAREAYSKAVPQESGTCLVCHTNSDMLTASLSNPDDDVNKYLVDESFATSTHGMLGCTYCHGGHPDKVDASAAMQDINATPTADGGQAVCGTCHADVVETFSTSLHNTAAGLKHAWENRLSVASDNLGTNLADQYYHHDGYEGACIDCHATCGECHVRSAKDLIDPDTGLTEGHNFVDLTDNADITYTCLSCHAGAIAGCYTNQDVHGLSGANMNCMDCHKIEEIHGDGNEYATMSHSGAITTECTDCHDASTLTGQWHSQTHLDANECWACHTQSYNTCESCHGWFAATRDESDKPIEQHDDCYLGYDTGNGKITTLVKAPIDVNMLGDATDLVLDEADLNTGSSWYAGFTHGVIKPEVNQQFCDRCHGEGTDLLKEEDLQFPDYESEQMVGSLPQVDVQDYIESSE